jgi:hypothetical protein
MKPSLQKLYDANIADFGHLRPPQIMGLTIYAEARGEITVGKIGVGTVILERVDHRAWDGNTIMEVCLWPYQFSCYLPGDPNRRKLYVISINWDDAMTLDPALNDCYGIASGLIDGTIPRDPELALANCCQYLTTAAKTGADWWVKMRFLKKMGAHEFYA